MDIGFSVLLMGVVITMLRGAGISGALVDLLVANMYAVGFILVVMGRSELFTEHTALAVFPVLAGKAKLRALARLWGVVYVANLTGAVLFAGLLTVFGPRLGVVSAAAFGAIAEPLVGHPWWIVLLSGLLAGWLMGLLSWLVSAARETISQVFFVWLVATAIGLAHLHHSIVGTVEVLAAVFVGSGVTMLDFGHFLLWTTLGNAVGGVVFVAAVKYSHAIRTAEHEEGELDEVG